MNYQSNILGINSYLCTLIPRIIKIPIEIFTFILLSMCFCNAVFAQSAKNDSLIFKSGAVGNSTSSYSGASGYSVPLFNVESRGINIPVSLNYNSLGFQPNTPVSSTGLNWQLAAQGQITRKINHIPDDHNASCTDRYPMGFFVGTKNNSSITDAQVFSFSVPFNDNCGEYNPGFDYAPDEFSFNCFGHSGKFYVTNGGGVKVISNENVRVDLTNFTAQNVLDFEPAPSTIVLTTSDGYRFTFGGELKNLDYSVPMADMDHFERGAAITTWHLTKVVSPNNHVINYIYKQFEPSIWENGTGRLYDQSYVFNIFLNSQRFYSKENYGALNPLIHDSPPKNEDAYRFIKTAYLERIESADFKMIFNYSSNDYKFYSNASKVADFGSLNTLGCKLDDITLYNRDSDLIKKYTFNYQYLGGTYGFRKFLTSIIEPGKGSYSFDYYRTNELPGVHVRNVDYWGFWKGGYDEAAILIPAISQNSSGDQIISSPLREPNGSFCNVGMLKTVRYPTGGETSFVYEPHSYSKRLERRASSNFLPAVFDVTGIAGGARIKEITDSAPGGSSVIKKNFFYNTNYIDGGTISSGFLMDWPRYIWEVSFSGPFYDIERKQHRAFSYNLNYNLAEPFINYAEVTMETTGNGYKVVKFNNYLTNPDVKDFNVKIFENSYPASISIASLYDNYKGYVLNDRSIDRGNMNFEGYYDKNKTPIKSKMIFYTPFSPADYIVSTKYNLGNMQAYKIYTRPSRVKQITEVNHTSTAMTYAREFTYDENAQNLIMEKASISDNKVVMRRLFYPSDYPSGPAFIASLKSNGITSVPIEEVTSQLKGNSESILSGKIFNYTDKGNLSSIYNLEINAPIPLSGFKFSNMTIGNLPSPSATKQPFNIDLRYKAGAGFTYDPYGNPIEAISKIGIKSMNRSFKWGYGNQFLVAEIRNSRINNFYVENFEDVGYSGFDSNLKSVTTRAHTGNFSGSITNELSGEEVKCFHRTVAVWFDSPIPRRFTFSGWMYSEGPEAEITLLMFKDNEQGDYTYTDNLRLNQPGKWIYVKKNIIIPNDVTSARIVLNCKSNGTVYFDDIALRPTESELKTFTYKPFVGITSKIDENGITSYFDYDQYQRLINVKDQNGNIIKNNSYYYKP